MLSMRSINCNFDSIFQSFIHVSTAYSNADKRDVEEIVYDPPHDPSTIINCVDALPQEAVQLLSEKLLVSGMRLKNKRLHSFKCYRLLQNLNKVGFATNF